MRIHIASDIHLEFGHVPHLPGGDVLILAGDTLVVAHLCHEFPSELVRRARKKYIDFFSVQASKYAHVFAVMGNHEHYKGVLEQSAGIYRMWLGENAPNVRLLDDEAITLEGVTFVGSTLWAPCRRRDGGVVERVIGRGMNDFRLIQSEESLLANPALTPTPVTTAQIRHRHNRHVRWLRRALPKHAESKVVVITHHAPSFRSAAGHAGNDFSSAYCSNQEKMIAANPHVIAWVHGHTHYDVDYRIGETRVLTNQHGYFGHERIAREFDAARKTLEL